MDKVVDTFRLPLTPLELMEEKYRASQQENRVLRDEAAALSEAVDGLNTAHRATQTRLKGEVLLRQQDGEELRAVKKARDEMRAELEKTKQDAAALKQEAAAEKRRRQATEAVRLQQEQDAEAALEQREEEHRQELAVAKRKTRAVKKMHTRLRRQLEEVQVKLKLAEEFAGSLKEEIRCPDCNRDRGEWYEVSPGQ